MKGIPSASKNLQSTQAGQQSVQFPHSDQSQAQPQSQRSSHIQGQTGNGWSQGPGGKSVRSGPKKKKTRSENKQDIDMQNQQQGGSPQGQQQDQQQGGSPQGQQQDQQQGGQDQTGRQGQTYGQQSPQGVQGQPGGQQNAQGGQQAFTSASSAQQSGMPQATAGAGLNDFGDDLGGLGAGSFGGGFGAGGIRGTPGGTGLGGLGSSNRQDRTSMIKKLYKEVLGREAQMRDINYYKYGTQNEEQVRAQLIKSDEHKKLVKDGQKYEKVSKELEETKTKLNASEVRVNDINNEVETLKQFLNQKNAEITKLRASNKSLSSDISLNPTRPSYHSEAQGLIRTNGQPQNLSQAQIVEAPRVSSELTTQSIAGDSQSQPKESNLPMQDDPFSNHYSPPVNPSILPAETTSGNQPVKKPDIIDRITSIFF